MVVRRILQQETALREHLKPSRQRMEQIQAEVTSLMTQQGIKSLKTDTGTAILSTIVTPKILDKEKFLDFVLEDWDNRGAMLQIGAPQKDALQEYMDANENRLPPAVDVSTFVRFSIRKA